MRFIEIKYIFKDYRNREYNIRISIEYRIYKKSHDRLITLSRLDSNYKIIINDIKLIIKYKN